MQVNVQEAQPGTAELEVLVDSEQFGKAIDETIDQIAQTAQIPGFRKGKAPRAMVERSVSPEMIRARAMDRVLPGAYRQALDESGLQPLTEPEIELLPSENEREFRFKLIVHKKPEITPGPIRDLELVQYVTSITDEDVEQELQDIRERSASYQPVNQDEPGAEAQKGDVVVIDVEVRQGDEPIADANAEDLPVRVGQYAQVPSIDDDLVGLKAGDVRDIEVQYPDTFQSRELQGLNATWHVVVKEVRRRHVPELTDDFVKERNLADTVDELREKTRSDLVERAKNLDDNALKSQAMKKIQEGSQVVFPHILVHQEMEGRVQRLERDMARSRRTLADLASSQGVTQAALMQQMHDQAEADLAEFLLVHRIAEQEGIAVSPEEVDAQIEKEALARGARPAIIALEKKNDTRRSAITYGLLKERVLDLALQHAKITTRQQSMSQANESGAAEVGS